MFKTSLLALLLFTATARAQDEPTEPTPTPAAPAAAAPAAGSAGGAFQKGTLGFSLPIALISNLGGAISILTEPVSTVDVVYFLDGKSAIDVIAGINLHHEAITNNATPPVTTTTTLFG